jgi:hypothetical protein
MYPSRVARPGARLAAADVVYFRESELPAGFGDYSAFDPLVPAIDEAHRLGIEIFAWYTGCEEDHGSRGSFSEFCAAHPEYLQENVLGEKLRGNLCFAFPEVLDYKRKLMAEFLDRGFDGLMLDCSRENGFSRRWLTHLVARGGDTRVPQGGYEAPVREAFAERYGRDPRRLGESGDWFEVWWRFKSEYYPTPLVRAASEAARARGLPLGLISAVCPIMPGLWYPGATHGYYLDPIDEIEALFRRIQQLARGRCKVRWLNYFYPLSAVLGYYGEMRHPIRGIPASPPPGPIADVVRGRVELARRTGADGFIVFETNHPEAWDLWGAIS